MMREKQYEQLKKMLHGKSKYGEKLELFKCSYYSGGGKKCKKHSTPIRLLRYRISYRKKKHVTKLKIFRSRASASSSTTFEKETCYYFSGKRSPGLVVLKKIRYGEEFD
jgi:hypothetical protein